ncbi:MAG TPA: FtsH protease activity modulator HflK [Oceanicaulis sp.]|nr:FtsH protease activity modulator HflK [Oceanicaulis sp.]
MDRKERTVLITAVINVLLILFKFWLSVVSGSIALRSSALHSLTDLAIGLFVLAGLYLSRRIRGSDPVRQGVGALENLIALIVSGAIFYVGIEIVIDVLAGTSAELRNLVPITLASLVTVAVAYVIARYKLYVGRQTGSPALIASGYHSQVDIYASIVVVVGLAGSALGLSKLDLAAAAIVAVMVFLSGFQIAASAIAALRQRRLLDLEGETGVTAPKHVNLRAVVPAGAFLIAGLFLVSGFYTVQPGETAVVRRFGAVVARTGPGLHYRWPAPVERVDVVASDQVRRIETPPTQMLTGDENLISVRASVHYTVQDPAAYLLNVADPEELVMETSIAAFRGVVAGESVDALLTVDKTEIEQKAMATAQAALDRNESGLRVSGVQLLESAPPREVAEAFRDVASAREDRNTFVNEATAYRNEVLPVARGDADRMRQSAQAYAAERLARASGEAARFVARQTAYSKAPEITRQRLYLEAVERSLNGVRKLIVDPATTPDTTDLWLPQPSSRRLQP